jgi:RecJ-like exonuclease
MADAVPGALCDHCEGRGWWASGCESEVDCFQCQGTGVARPRGNCDWCLGYGATVMGGACERCSGSGWIPDEVALYWCTECTRTIASAPAAPACPHGPTHPLERVTAAARP